MNNAIYQTSQKTLIICAALALTASLVQGQTIYRFVGPNGKVTFSDKAPAESDQVTSMDASGNSVDGGASLPFALRQVASKYPVTLFTSNNCVPCSSGRALLSSRGIPFAEKTVTTAEDIDALQRLSGENSMPFLTIGGQQIKGFSDSEWTQFLDAAGYPKSSALPASYRSPAATPLVSVQKPTPAVKTEAAPRSPVGPGRAPVDNSSNPAGIKF